MVPPPPPPTHSSFPFPGLGEHRAASLAWLPIFGELLHHLLMMSGREGPPLRAVGWVLLLLKQMLELVRYVGLLGPAGAPQFSGRGYLLPGGLASLP